MKINYKVSSLLIAIILAYACSGNDFNGGLGAKKASSSDTSSVAQNYEHRDSNLNPHTSGTGSEKCSSTQSESNASQVTSSSSGFATTSGKSSSDTASVSCGDLQLIKGDDGQCHLIVNPAKVLADLSKFSVKISGENIPLSTSTSEVNALPSGNHSISLESKVGGAYSSCTMTISVP